MTAIRVLAQNGLRRRAATHAGLALVIALGLGTALGAFGVAWRTDHAYPDYLRRAEVGDVVVNPSLLTDRLKGVIGSTPGVVDVVSDALFIATLDDGHPRAPTDDLESLTQVRSSSDGRYRDRDRPVVHRGRMISGDGEAFLSRDAATVLGLDVGDEFPIAFWTATPNEDDLDPFQVIEPIGKSRARVVGVGAFADEVLPDDLYPNRLVLLSPDVTAPFDCTVPHPPPDDTLTLEQLIPLFFPDDCARDPVLYSIRVSGGDRGVPAVLASLTERLDQENARLPKVMRDGDLGFSIRPTLTADERTQVQRSLAPSVTALRLFGAVAALSTLAVIALASVRSVRRIEPQTRAWFELGMSRGERAAALGVPLVVAGLTGVAGALVAGWLASGIGPVASAGTLEPDPSRNLPVLLTVAVVAAALVVLAAEFAVAAWLGSEAASRPTPAARTSRLAEWAAGTGNLPLVIGVRAALPSATGASAGSRTVLVGAVTSVAAVVGCVVFSSNMSLLVQTPARFGWPFDMGAVINLGYAGADEEVVAASFDRPEIEEWAFAAMPGEVTINGEALPAIAGRPGFERFAVPVLAGKYPTGDDELALGALSADRLGLSIGDRVPVSTFYGEREATVSGVLVLPPIGPYLGGRGGLGRGTLLSTGFLDAVLAQGEQDRGLEPGTLGGALGAFVAVNLADGVDAARFAEQLAPETVGWDLNGSPPQLYGRAVRPAEIADVAAIRTAPALLAALLAGAMAAALGLAIALATRARRRELAILRALGCSGRQLRATVRWHALTVVGAGLLVGIVAGISLGSVTWRQFADGLGVGSSVTVPVGWIAVVAAAAVVLALVASAGPGRFVARSASAVELRDR